MTALLEARTRQALAKTVLTRAGAVEQSEPDALVRILDDAIIGVEELLSRFLKTFEGGVSLSDAAVVGRALTRSANLNGSSVELIASANPELSEWKKSRLDRLRRVKEQAGAMRRLAKIPPPALDPERMRRSQGRMERGEGFSTAEIFGKKGIRSSLK